MNYKKIWASLVAASTLLLGSCSGLGDFISPKKLDTVEGMQEVINGLQSQFADKPVYSFQVRETEQLSSKVGYLDVVASEQGNEVMKYDLSLRNGAWEPTFESGSVTPTDKTYTGFKGIDLKALSAEKMIGYIQEAIKLLPEEYEFESVGSYTVEELYEGKSYDETLTSTGLYEHRFELHVTEKGKSTEIKGRRIETTYYGVKFKVGQDGSLSIEE